MVSGQASLEYLTTYGWAFMIILIIMGAISYFGVTNVGQYVPDQCRVQSDFGCDDYMVDAGEYEIRVLLQNQMRDSVYLEDGVVEFERDSTTFECALESGFSDPLGPGERVELVCDPTTLKNHNVMLVEGDKARFDYSFVYTRSEDGGFPHRVSGELVATVS